MSDKQQFVVEVEVTDWWCPSERRWVWCPGPCPDGTPHSESRTRLLASSARPTPVPPSSTGRPR